MTNDARTQLSLDDLIARGLTVSGRTVDRVKFRIPGVGWSMIAIPIGDAAVDDIDDGEDGELTETQKRILAVLAKAKSGMTRRAIANAMGRESVSGKFGQYILDLLSRGMVFELNGEYADHSDKLKST